LTIIPKHPVQRVDLWNS